MVKPDELTHKHRQMKHNKVKARKIAKITFLAGFVLGGSLAAIFHDYSAYGQIDPDPELRWEIVRMQEEIQALENALKLRESEEKSEDDVIYQSDQKNAHTASGKASGHTVGRLTAYSCNGITNDAERRMNCPSTFNGSPKTANGTEPIVDKTMACDPANMGRTFYIEGIGERTCTDTGGAIKGSGRFDLYVSDIQTARQFGVQYANYTLID